MSRTSHAIAIVFALVAAITPALADRATAVNRDAFVCTSWAAWREYGQASLTPRGARISKLCPRRLGAGTKVVVVEEDAGAGASEIRYRERNWFIDAQRLR